MYDKPGLLVLLTFDWYLVSNLTFRQLIWNLLCGYTLSQKKETQDPAASVVGIVPEKPFSQVYNAQGQFSLDENIGRGFTDTPNPDI
jgi:hypothetical protein